MAPTQVPVGKSGMPRVVVSRMPNITHIWWPDMDVEIYHGWKYKQCVDVYRRINGRKIQVGSICREAQVVVNKPPHSLLIDGKLAQVIKEVVDRRFPGPDAYIIELPADALVDVRRVVEEAYLKVLGG